MRESPRGPLRLRLRAASALLAIGCALGCARDEGRVAERVSPPPGAWLAGDAAALSRFLGRLEGLRGSELARSAALMQERATGCERVLAHAADGSAHTLATDLHCAAAGETPVTVDALRADDSLVLSLPFESMRLDVRASLDAAGDVEARISLVAVDEGADAAKRLPPAARLFLPASRDAGPARLNPDATLVHARLRPEGGIDPAALLPEVDAGGPLRKLSGLAGSLLGAAVFDGTWELAAYLPSEGSAMPPTALAFGLSAPSAARSALDAVVARLEATWPIRHRDARFGVDAEGSVAEGGCFLDVPILPEFAPCWVVLGDLLVVGWNPQSVQRSLAPRSEIPGGAEGARGPTRGVLLALDRWELADAAIGRVRAVGELRRALHYGWRRAALEALPAQGADDTLLSLRLQLAGAERS